MNSDGQKFHRWKEKLQRELDNAGAKGLMVVARNLGDRRILSVLYPRHCADEIKRSAESVIATFNTKHPNAEAELNFDFDDQIGEAKKKAARGR